MSADKELKAYIDRVLRLKEEQDALAQDIREVYAEAKMGGYDKTVMGKLVAYLRKIEKAGPEAANEAEAVFDTYLDAYQRASGMRVATHTHEADFDRETGEVFDAPVSPRLVKQVVDGMQTEAGRAALVAAVDIMIEREEAEERNTPSDVPASVAAVISSSHDTANEEVAPGLLANSPETVEQADPAVAAVTVGDDLREPAAAEQGQIIREGDAPRETDRFGGDASRPDTDQPEQATTQRVNGHSQHEGANAQATVRNEVVTVVGTESGTVAIPKPAPTMAEQRIANALVLRPNCRRPGQETCGGQGRTHCRDCITAPAEREREDA